MRNGWLGKSYEAWKCDKMLPETETGTYEDREGMSNRRRNREAEAEAEGRRDDYTNGTPTSGPVAQLVRLIGANCCDSFEGREVSCCPHRR